MRLSWKSSCQKITELEALCNRLREDAQKLRKEKSKLEGMIESHNELIMEFANEIALNGMGEQVEDEDDNDGGDAAAPPAPAPSPVPTLPAAACEVIIIKDEDPM
jgi:hypothetical protein